MLSIRISGLAIVFAGLLVGQGNSIQHAIELQRAGDLEGAAREYRDFLASNPNQPGIHSNLGVVLTQLGRFEDAVKEYNEALRLDPSNSGVKLNLALAYYKSGRIPEAVSQLSTLQAGDQVTLLLADCYLRTGENKKVIALLQPLREQKPDDLGVSYLLGTALIRDGRVADGQVVIDRILKDSNSAEAHFLIGSQMFAAKDFPSAIKEFQAAAALNPNVPSLQSYYGQALLNTGDPDAASLAFRKELARDPNDFDANFHLAEILMQRGKTDEAAPLLERADRVRPGVAALLRHSGTAVQHSPLLGKKAPDFTLPRVTSHITPAEPVSLHSFRGNAPVLLMFGSYSCPNFRAAAPALNAFYKTYGDHVRFLMVYIREAHSTADWQSTRNERDGIVVPLPKTMAEKSAAANMCVRKLNLPFTAVVDGLDGSMEAAYSAWPSRAYLIDENGVIQYGTGLTELDFHADDLEAALKKVAK